MTDDMGKRLHDAAVEERDCALEQDFYHEELLFEAATSFKALTAQVAALTAERDNYKLCALHSGDVVEAAEAEIERLRAQLAEDADVRKQIDYRLAELVAQVDALTAELAEEKRMRQEEKAKILRQRTQLESIQKANRNNLPMRRGLQRRVAELEAAEADNARLRDELTKAADSLDWADAHLEDAGVVSANVRYGARDARAALTEKETK
jgi:chromosome segregation ATPase